RAAAAGGPSRARRGRREGGPPPPRHKRSSHRLWHPLCGHHVRLTATALGCCLTNVGNAVLACEACAVTARGKQRQLAGTGGRVWPDQLVDDLSRPCPISQSP